MIDGILIIDKPAGYTSHDVVARLRRILRTKRIGHTGTLDPFATGVLVMLIGRATRLARFLDQDIKEYEALLQFGRETDTGDCTGLRISDFGFGISEMSEILEGTDWDDVFEGFRGQIEQIPPMYSAKKIKGKKLYELARQGIEIDREPVKITIHELELAKSPRIPHPETQIGIRIRCSAGTYIRTLAEEIGRKLKIGAHLAELRRTRAGRFDLSAAVSIGELEEIAENNDIGKVLVSMNDAVAHLPQQTLSGEDVAMVITGRRIKAVLPPGEGEYVRLPDAAGNLIAIGTVADEKTTIRPRLVFS